MDGSNIYFYLRQIFFIMASAIFVNQQVIANSTTETQWHPQCQSAKECHEQTVNFLEGKLEIRAVNYNPINKNAVGEALQYVLVTSKQIYYLHFIDTPPAFLKT